jgi:glycosyltransferase 2 family protein
MIGRRSALLATAGMSLLILAVLMRELEPQHLLRVFADTRWSWLIAAAALNLLNTAVEAVRWTLLASPLKPGLRIWPAFRALIAGTLGNVVLPMKLGDGVRAFVYADSERLPFSSAISTVVLDRMLDLSAFLFFVLVTLLVYPLPAGVLHVTRYVFVALLAGMASLLVMSAVGRQRAGRDPEGTGSRVLSRLDRFASGLSALRRGGLLGPAAAVALLSWATRLALVWAGMKAFHLDVPLTDAAAVLVMINVGIAVVPTPGNVGPFEVAAVAAVRLIGAGEATALSFALGLHLAEVLPPVLLGLGLMWRGDLDFARAKRASATQPEAVPEPRHG